ncbi:AMP-binding protein [Mucilaginibacter sp. P25]|uniref:AMP-binding protein n=1 Tax=Mucilaginibacter sp. P25 TaxID=3423945 RepID=UPI003D7BE2B5
MLSEFINLHPAQLDVFFDQTINLNSPHYNIGGFIKLKGKLNKEYFKEAAKSVPSVFDAFQMRFTDSGTDTAGFSLDSAFCVFDIAEEDFSGQADPAEAATNWAQCRFNTPFDINHEPMLFEQALLKISEGEYWFYIRIHHLIIDGFGFTILFDYISKKYLSLVNGTLDIFEYPSYVQEVKRASQFFSSPMFQSEGDYWKEKLSTSAKNKVLKRQRLGDCSKRKSDLFVYFLSNTQRSELNRLAIETKSSLLQLTFAALILYWGKTTDFSEFIFGVSVHKRRSRDIRKMVGMFAGILPFKGVFKEDSLLIDLLRNISNAQKSDYRNQTYLFGDIIRDQNRINDIKNFIEVFVNYEHLDFELDFGPEINAVSIDLSSEFDNKPLQFGWRDYGTLQPLRLRVGFQDDYFSFEEVKLLTHRIIHILEQFPSMLNERIGDLELLPESELGMIVEEFNSTATVYPSDVTVVDLFESQVLLSGSSVAVVYEGESLSYSELDARSNALGHYLRSRGVREDTLVGICIDRSLEMIVGLLGILKAGGAYVPIDPDYPQDRIAYMLEDTGSRLLLSSSRVSAGLSMVTEAEVVELDRDWAKIASYGSLPVERSLQPTHLAYVIYTSGSTGTPKGVMVEHRSVLNYINWSINNYGTTVHNYGLFTSLSFDLTVTSIFSPLLSGSFMRFYEPSADLSSVLKSYLEDNGGLEIIKLTPSHINLLAELDIRSTNLKTVIVGVRNYKAVT